MNIRLRQIMDEGAINSAEMTKKVMVLMKDIIKEVIGPNAGMVLPSDEVLQQDMDILNETIKTRIVDKGIISCPIKFDITKGSSGIYRKDTKDIVLNREYFLLNYVGEGKYRFKRIRDIKFSVMSNTIEHELIHQQQDEKSGGMFLKGKTMLNFIKRYLKDRGSDMSVEEFINIVRSDNKLLLKYFEMDKKLINKEYKDIIKIKQHIDPEASDKDFIEDVEYYNNSSELNTFAKEAVNKYIKNSLIYLKNDITFRFKKGEIESKKLSGEEVRRLILPFLYSGKSNNSKLWSSSNVNIKKKILSYSNGYKYLTVENKKKWWRYVFQLLMSIKFEDI